MCSTILHLTDWNFNSLHVSLYWDANQNPPSPSEGSWTGASTPDRMKLWFIQEERDDTVGGVHERHLYGADQTCGRCFTGKKTLMNKNPANASRDGTLLLKIRWCSSLRGNLGLLRDLFRLIKPLCTFPMTLKSQLNCHLFIHPSIQCTVTNQIK